MRPGLLSRPGRNCIGTSFSELKTAPRNDWEVESAQLSL